MLKPKLGGLSNHSSNWQYMREWQHFGNSIGSCRTSNVCSLAVAVRSDGAAVIRTEAFSKIIVSPWMVDVRLHLFISLTFFHFNYIWIINARAPIHRRNVKCMCASKMCSRQMSMSHYTSGNHGGSTHCYFGNFRYVCDAFEFLAHLLSVFLLRCRDHRLLLSSSVAAFRRYPLIMILY